MLLGRETECNSGEYTEACLCVDYKREEGQSQQQFRRGQGAAQIETQSADIPRKRPAFRESLSPREQRLLKGGWQLADPGGSWFLILLWLVYWSSTPNPPHPVTQDCPAPGQRHSGSQWSGKLLGQSSYLPCTICLTYLYCCVHKSIIETIHCASLRDH